MTSTEKSLERIASTLEKMSIKVDLLFQDYIKQNLPKEKTKEQPTENLPLIGSDGEFNRERK